MKKKSIIISILLICSMLLSFTPVIFGNYASASTGAANFLPNVFFDPTNKGFDTLNEIQRSQNVTNYISSLLVSRYGSGCVTTGINGTATKLNYQARLSNLQNYDKIVFFSKGHRSNTNNQLGIIPNYTTPYPDPSSYLLGSEIYPYTSAKNVVTFMWHCETALSYPGNGLPYSFTHNNGMNYYDNTGSQVYLGWSNKYVFTATYPNGTQNTYSQVGSPQYEWKMTPSNDYGRIAELYWYYMCLNKSSIEALDQATFLTQNVYFGYSNIYYWLIIWGNQDLTLP